MLHNMLGFGGRMARFEYFLACMGLGVLTLLVVLALVLGFRPDGGSIADYRTSVPPGLILTLLLVVLPFYLWFSLAFQAKRIRDIGWKPIYVLPGWIAAVAFDRLVAHAIPGLAVSAGGGTLLGTFFNLGMALCLMFWPGRPATASGTAILTTVLCPTREAIARQSRRVAPPRCGRPQHRASHPSRPALAAAVCSQRGRACRRYQPGSRLNNYKNVITFGP